MAILTPEQWLKQTGAKASDVRLAAPATATPAAAAPAPEGALGRGVRGYLSDTAGDIAQTGRDLWGTAKETTSNVGAAAGAALRGESTPLAGAYNTVGALAGGVSSALGDVVKGGAKVLLTPEDEARVGGAVRDIGTAIAETEPVKKLVANYALLDPEQKRQVDASLGFASFLADVAGFGKARKPVAAALDEAADAAVDLGGAGTGSVKAAAGAAANAGRAVSGAAKTVSVAADPTSIMNRVARVTPSRAVKFAKLSGGDDIGSYLVKRGIYGDVEEVAKQLYGRFQQSREAADAALAKLPGTYQPTPIKTALGELLSREVRVSPKGVMSPDLKRVMALKNKLDAAGLDMSEINEVKRLYEKNIRLDYLRQNLPEGVARATNLDSAIREWQMAKAESLGLANLRSINKETQLARELADALGREYGGKLGNNAITITDWILLAGGDPTALAAFGLKKLFSNKTVLSAIARKLGGKATVGAPEATFKAAKPGLEDFMRRTTPGDTRSTPPRPPETGLGKPQANSATAPTPVKGAVPSPKKKGSVAPAKTVSAPTSPSGVKAAVPTRKITVPASLVAEARKYRTAEEFVNNQPFAYRGVSARGNTAGNQITKGVYLTPDETLASRFGNGNVEKVYYSPESIFDWRNKSDVRKLAEYVRDSEPALSDSLKQAIGEVSATKTNAPNYRTSAKLADAIERIGFKGTYEVEPPFMDSANINLFSKEAIKTKQQLLDIWRAANRKGGESASMKGSGAPGQGPKANMVGKGARTFRTAAAAIAPDANTKNVVLADIKLKPKYAEVADESKIEARKNALYMSTLRANPGKNMNTLVREGNANALEWTRLQSQQLSGLSLRDAIDYPALFAAYPEAKNIRLRLMGPQWGKSGTQGEFSMYSGEAPIITVYTANSADVAETIKHELQHYIQAKENWPRGGSPNAIYEAPAQYLMFSKLRDNLFERANRGALEEASIRDLLYINQLIEMTRKGTPAAHSDLWQMFGGQEGTDRFAWRLYRDLYGEVEARANGIPEGGSYVIKRGDGSMYRR